MRLRRLEFEGIGSFADRMEIDFETLGGAGMFLVEGPTGSGKSTILDAIVFALYGSVAGSASDPGRLDSHVRDQECPPYVELDFTCGEATYRIRRTPRHERRKRRGSGTMRDEGGVSLVRLSPEPASVSHKAKEVGEWVIAQVGLTKQQFVSTIVLAQGEFAAFLDADTATRAQILEKVFGTRFYKEVEDQLAVMRKAAATRRATAARALEETRHRLLGVLGIGQTEDPDAAVTDRLAVLHEELQHAREQLQEAERARARAEGDLAAAREVARLQQRKRDLHARQQDLHERRPQVERARAAVTGHERAVPAGASLEAWRRAESACTAALKAAATAQAAVTSAGGTGWEVPDAAELAELLGALRGPEQIEAGLARRRAAVQALDETVGRRQERVALLAPRVTSLAAELEALRTAVILPPTGQGGLADLRVRQTALRQQVDLARRVEADLAAQAQARDLVAQTCEVLTAREEDLHVARALRDRDHAAMLADRLVAGQPCLVCGATEHPAPAVPADPSAGPDLAVAEVAVEAARARWLQARAALDRLDGALAEARRNLPDDLDTLTASLEEVTVRIEAAAEVEAAAAARDQRVGELTEAWTEAQSALAEERVTLERESAERAAAAGALSDDEQVVRTAAGDHPSVSARILATERLHTLVTAAREATDRAAAAQVAAADAKRVLEETLASLGLQDVAQVQAALLEDERLAALRTEVAEHDRAVTEVAAGLLELQEVDLRIAPDVPGLDAARAAAQSVCEQRLAAVTRREHVLQEAAPLLGQLSARQQESAIVQEQTAGVIRMADLATATRGEVTHRVKLSSFVLMRRFESVVEAANDRLDAISEGRYQLRAQAEGLDARGQAGLDLVVADQRTERERSTRSLSGGERFYVSLALALGLADVVRSESGGVRLGTLFIDEGFGSLDAEVLEEVMDMLEQVRAGEDRVIGLVSHVDLLKQRIDPRISVRRDPQRPGVSTVQVHV